MKQTEPSTNSTKCYNSWSCILSVLIIIFVIGSIIYDITISKPQMQKDIKEIRENVRQLNEKIDAQQMYILEMDTIDSLNVEVDTLKQ